MSTNTRVSLRMGISLDRELREFITTQAAKDKSSCAGVVRKALIEYKQNLEEAAWKKQKEMEKVYGESK